jgi:site-specific DNA-methyltransferase (adenine-specific)
LVNLKQRFYKESESLLELNKIYNEDCLDGMKLIPDKSIDAIICDPPFGTTKLKWDSVIPLDLMWNEYNRIIKDNGVILIFGQEPFSSTLRMSNIKYFKYDWYWQKTKPQGFLNAKKMPLKDIEIISVFYKKQPVYNPQGIKKADINITRADSMLKKGNHLSAYNGGDLKQKEYVREFTGYPRQVLTFSVEGKPKHPTQKPVNLIEYLLLTYTNEGMTVLDNCMGSGTTAVACINMNRNYIGFELDKEYHRLAEERIHNLV